jgi:hypothetical protein
LPLERWKATYATLHREAQIIGKMLLALTPRVNHFWNATFALTPRGLTTGLMPYGDRTLAIDFDFIGHELVVETNSDERRTLRLAPRSVADFLREMNALLAELDIHIPISDRPVELMEELIPFSRDRLHAAYDPESVERCLRILQSTAVVLEQFRAGFVGKASPVLFYWGTFDLACSRFSGRRAPARPGADAITREAYSHEVFSCGFWPGDMRWPGPAFYAYIAPSPPGFPAARLTPATAGWQANMGEFLLPYDDVRLAADPGARLYEFCQSAYAAAADLAAWDRPALERQATGEAVTAVPPVQA